MIESGFQVKIEIKDTYDNKGKGIFLKEDVVKGQLLWKCMKNINIRCYNESSASKHLSNLLNDDDKYFWISHIYHFDGELIEILDDACYWNHDDNPNTGGCLDLNATDEDQQHSYALRDIKAGEELLDDYNSYEYPQYLINLYNEYHVPTKHIKTLN